MARIGKGDQVQVISGRDKGKQGKVMMVKKKSDRIIVEGVNMVFKHMRRSQDHPQGARIQKEAGIHISNVMLIDPKDGKPTRTRYEVDAKAQTKAGRTKKRIAVRSGEEIEKQKN